MARKTIAELERTIELMQTQLEIQQNKILDLNNEIIRKISEIEKLKEQLQAAQNNEHITERFLEIPTVPKRGPKPKADLETRQYIHELYKPLIPGTKNRHVNSLQAIGTITGLSKTQVFAIVKEPEIPGRWYSIENGHRVYYDNYTAAVRSRKTIHFEADLTNQS